MRGSAEVSSGGSDEMERLEEAHSTKIAAARDLLASNDESAQVLARTCAPSRAKQARRSPVISTWSATASSTASTSPSHRRLNCRTHSCKVHPHRRFRRSAGRVGRRCPHCRGPRPGSRGAPRPNSTNCSARPVSPIASATSVASTATSGPRGSCGARPLRLAGGSRVSGRIATPQQMLDASLDEMCTLVADTGGPSADELAKRAAYRAAYTAKDVPPFLGPPAPATS